MLTENILQEVFIKEEALWSNTIKEIKQIEERVKDNHLPIEFEDKNFRVDSTGWEEIKDEKGNIVGLENFEGDIVELPNREQYFTRDAAVRETEREGERLPNSSDILYFRDIDDKDVMLNPVYVGCIKPRKKGNCIEIREIGKNANFWTSELSGGPWEHGLILNVFIATYYTPNIIVMTDNTYVELDYMLSVRCIKKLNLNSMSKLNVKQFFKDKYEAEKNACYTGNKCECCGIENVRTEDVASADDMVYIVCEKCALKEGYGKFRREDGIPKCSLCGATNVRLENICEEDYWCIVIACEKCAKIQKAEECFL